jgi:hypothetical protein
MTELLKNYIYMYIHETTHRDLDFPSAG